ncbi:multimerin-2a [Clarias gariepinus]|uniref:multimerin-2a n=1 Tax=Clarias gariepinus TaxID=13013 RepID=UPI00234DEAAF|nr:multimerin-2a [Clarias gariepinus]
MIVLKVFLLLQGVLLAARCDVWPKDQQQLKDGEDKKFKHVSHHHQDGWNHGHPHEHSGTDHHSAGAQKESGDVSGTVRFPQEHVSPSHMHPSEDLPGNEEGGSAEPHSNITPARMGNWCAFVHKRVVTMSVACGTEKYIIKSQSPCPNGTPDCYLVMYKVSTRPVYREQQKILTSLSWRCCPGHGGSSCDDIVENGPESEASNTDIGLHPEGPVINHTGPEKLTHNQNQEQNHHHESRRLLSENLQPEVNQTEGTNSNGFTPSSYTGHEPHHEKDAPSAPPGVDNGHRGAPPPETHYTNPGLVPIHYLKDVMMSHLQPIFDSFNLTLARLSEEVKDLQKDMTEMQVLLMVQGESNPMGGKISQASDHEAMADSLQKLSEQLGLQRDEMEEKLHAQQAMLTYNLTNLKIDMDVQNKRNQKMLQMSLHSINSSLLETREKQGQLEEIVSTLVSQIPSRGRQPQEDAAVWEAITRLDNKVVNNTIHLSVIKEDKVQVSEKIKNLQKHYKTLEERVTQEYQRNKERYIEAFLEVDAAKESVGKYVDDLSKNVTTLQVTVHELEVDVDYLYTHFYNISSGSRACDCTGFSISVAQLKQEINNLTAFANENRIAIDNAAEEQVNIWENGASGSQVEEIKLSLHTVQDMLALEQEKRKTLQQTLQTGEKNILGIKYVIEELQKHDAEKAVKINYLSNSFDSLKKDAQRHSDVLEFLLDEEVLVFIERSEQDKRAYSILALKKVISDLQEQINAHSRSLASMLNSEDPTGHEPLQMADWITQDLKRIQNPEKFRHFSEEPAVFTDSDFIALEKTVEELQEHVVKLGEQKCLSCCNCSKGAHCKNVEGKLQAELTSVRKSLDDHLKIFSSIFSNTEGLTDSEATVDLNKLSAIMKRKEAKHQRKRQQKSETRDAQRSKRYTSLKTTVYSQLSENPFMFVANNRDGVNTPGTVVFETTSLNHGQMYSPETGTFRAPVAGVYLFVVTLDFGPGPSLAQLKRGEEVAASLHQSMRKSWGPATRVCLLQLQQGEEIQLELVQGTLEHGKPQENTFAGLLLLQHT